MGPSTKRVRCTSINVSEGGASVTFVDDADPEANVAAPGGSMSISFPADDRDAALGFGIGQTYNVEFKLAK